MDVIIYGSYKLFKDGKLDVLFYGTSLGSKYGIVLGSPVGALVGY